MKLQRLIFSILVAATLHCNHAISGLRAGTLPGVSQQNAFLGLPLTLMQEETAFLVKARIAHLIPVHPQPTLPLSMDIEEHTRARIERLKAVEEAMREVEEVRAEMGKERFDSGGEFAKAKRELRARIKSEKARENEDRVDGSLFGKEEERSHSISTSASMGLSTPSPQSSERTKTPSALGPAAIGHFHEVRSHPHFPSLTLGSPITSLPHPLFPFPCSPRDRALTDTFAKLHSLNLRVGLGPRFGGEYLIYPGDYLRYHAHFTSQILVRDECIRPGEIVAWGRLGTGTKKAGLICCWDDGVRSEIEEGEAEVSFYSLEWANFG